MSEGQQDNGVTRALIGGEPLRDFDPSLAKSKRCGQRVGTCGCYRAKRHDGLHYCTCGGEWWTTPRPRESAVQSSSLGNRSGGTQG